MGDSKHGWLILVAVAILLAMSIQTKGIHVGITYVKNAVLKKAVCLDGSPPAYHLDKGSGAGIKNWLVHFEGGGWCNNVTTCLARRDTLLGSSKQMETELIFSGILSNIQKFNPDFYNRNRIKVRYCDGASFTGDVEAVNPATKFHFRGARAFVAIIENLLTKGMNLAQNAILSGCSAGRLTAILNCDKFRGLLPVSAKVKCLGEAGFFINAKGVSGNQHIQAFYAEVIATHGSAKNLPACCTSRMNPGLIKNILAPRVADPHGTWHNCKTYIRKCSCDQLKIMQYFRLQFISAINGLRRSSAGGMFINACYAHCQSEMQETWLRGHSPILGKTTISKAVGDWYYGQNDFRALDCAYPCNPTCHNRIYETNHDMKENSDFILMD